MNGLTSTSQNGISPGLLHISLHSSVATLCVVSNHETEARLNHS